MIGDGQNDGYPVGAVRGDLHRLPFPGEGDGVLYDVLEDLQHPVGVNGELGQLRRDVFPDPDVPLPRAWRADAQRFGDEWLEVLQMRLEGLASDGAGVCWLAIQVGSSAMPDHAVYIITDWTGIPANYNRGARMLDSLFFGGPSGSSSSKFKWQEPKPAPVGKSA